MNSTAQIVEEYIASLLPERQDAIQRVREIILNNLPEGYKESAQFGMISYFVPLETFPDTYNGKPLMYAALANQKNHMSLYLMCEYCESKTRSALSLETRSSRQKRYG